MKIKLSALSDIKSGHLFRSRLVNDRAGTVRVIQLKDVDDNGDIVVAGLFRVTLENVKGTSFLKKGDVIFKSKSMKNIAAVYKDDGENTIVTVHYFILRPDITKIMPEYLAWYLNQRSAQKYFDANAAGTRIPIVTKKILEEFEMVVPPIGAQKKIVAVYSLLRKEIKLLEGLKEKKETLVNFILTDVVNRS